MTISPFVLRGADIQALGWALLHFLWQGSAAAALLGSVNVLLARRSANLRYLAASLTLVLMVALPVMTFVSLRDAPAAWLALGSIPSVTGPELSAGVPAAPAPAVALRERLTALLPGFVIAWAAGVIVLSVRHLGGWTLAQRLKRSGRPLASPEQERMLAALCRRMRQSRPVRLCVSSLVEVPTVIGWLAPVILIPTSTLLGLSPAQLEVILAHELAHIRRLDYLVNLLQNLAEALLFYHPAVWWVSHRMRVEREHCCDDAAVSTCGDPVSYARALAELEGLRADLPGPVMAATGGSLFARVARLVGRPSAHGPRSSRWLAGLIALATLALAVAAGASVGGGVEPTAEVAPPSQALALVADGGPGALDSESREKAPAPARKRSAPSASTEPQRKADDSKAGDLPLEKILGLARAGVSPEFLDEMAAAGYPSLSWDQLLELRSNGVGPQFVRELAAEGYKGLKPDQLVSLRSQGVSPDFIHGLKAQGIEALSLSDLISLRSQGVSPEFVGGLKKLGYDHLSVTQLVTLRSQGVSPSYVSELTALGYRDLSPSRLIGLRSQGVTPEFVRELKDLGYAGLSVPVLVGLRSQGVTPDFVRGLKELGYTDVSPGALMEMRSQGVTPEFVRELKEAGWGGLSPQELIELRSNGVRADLLKRLKKGSNGGGSR